MRTRAIAGRPVGAVGLGAMELSVRSRPDEPDAVALIHRALAAGVTLIDTADAYCPTPQETGHNERLVGRALRTAPAGVAPLVATKGGQYRAPDGSFPVNGEPGYLREACERSLRNLGVEVIDLYQLHRPDPAVPYPESVGALADLQRAGKIRWVGVSNVSAEQLAQARREVEVVSVQNALSADEPGDAALAAACGADGIAYLAHSPLGGRHRAGTFGERHPAFAAVAAARGVSAQRVALAWLLALAPTVIPIPGARRVSSLLDSAAAADLALTADELSRLRGSAAQQPQRIG